MIAKNIEITVPIHIRLPTIPSQAKWINALLNKEINNLSPRVVSSPNIPLLGFPPGSFFSHITIQTKHRAINPKKTAVCQVQAIQVMKSKSKKPFF